jgi:hypothetical protein
MKICKLCKEEINSEATKCYHCKGWQSKTGIISSHTEKVILLAFITALIIIISTILYKSQYNLTYSWLTKNNGQIPITTELAINKVYFNSQKGWSSNRINFVDYFSIKNEIKKVENEITPYYKTINNIENCIFIGKCSPNYIKRIDKNNNNTSAIMLNIDIPEPVIKYLLLSIMKQKRSISSLRVSHDSIILTEWSKSI